MTPRIGALFAGYGGLEMGVQAVYGGSLAWYSEIDKGALKVLRHRFPGVPNIGDVTAVDWSAVEPVDILTGGFPCTDVSTSGRKVGVDDGAASGLWRHLARAISALRPPLVIVENVSGLLDRGFGRVVGDLAGLGYDAEWETVSACRVGAPFARVRVFIAAAPAGTYPVGLPGFSQLNGNTEEPATERPQWQQRHADRLAVEDHRLLDRWAQFLGRPAPDPLEWGINGQPRLTAAFHEWLLGLPEGWVTAVPGLTRNEALRLCGNGVVPQQCEAALRALLTWERVA